MVMGRRYTPAMPFTGVTCVKEAWAFAAPVPPKVDAGKVIEVSFVMPLSFAIFTISLTVCAWFLSCGTTVFAILFRPAYFAISALFFEVISAVHRQPDLVPSAY